MSIKSISKPKVLVLRAAGTNCDQETCYAFQLANAEVEAVHVNRVIEQPGIMDEYQILALPGGFSYGDDIAAGKILANQIIHHLRDALTKFVASDKLIIGICNGFQVLVKTGMLPGTAQQTTTQQAVTLQQATLTWNDSGQFEDRWVYLQPGTDKCIFINPGEQIYLPVAHAEGKICFADQDTLDTIKTSQVAFRYVDAEGEFGSYPVNPNGSIDHIAGLCDSTGRILGMMPHPERFLHKTNHPRWTREDVKEPQGLAIFTNAVKYFQ